MADVFSKKKRSEIMSKIRNKDTRIEELVRKWLYSKGIRYRKNDKRYLGKPDIIIPKYKTAIFIHGCFWHKHEGCKLAYTPKTRTDFWNAKISRNVIRDKNNLLKLKETGWWVITIWECELRKEPEKRLMRLLDDLTANASTK